MEYTAGNMTLWNVIIQVGIISTAILIANLLRRKIPLFRNSLMPTSVLAGFLLLIAESLGVLSMDSGFLEILTYHGIAIGFIAMSLRIPSEKDAHTRGSLTGPKSGALIVSTYLVQGIVGLLVTLLLSYTVAPGLFKASGVLLPMGYGQGPGQANNIGSSYEALGFAGGRSFGLSLAAAGYLCACIVGVIYLTVLKRKGAIKSDRTEAVQAATVDDFQQPGEIPVAESIDRFSIQTVLVLAVYFLTYLVTAGIDKLLTAVAPGIAGTVVSLLWGFNFIIGSALAILIRVIMKRLRGLKIMSRQYQNNYLLSRISGVAFDIMIVAGIASINIEDLSGLWLPFVILAVLGGVVTLLYLNKVCRIVYPDYYHEGFASMYGMLTGTISSGVLLLREIDPAFETPAANNLVIGSSFGIVFGAPMLLLVGMAPNAPWVVLVIMVAYLALLILFLLKAGTGARRASGGHRVK